MRANQTIRAATPKDALAVARIHIESWRITYRDIIAADLLAGLDVEKRAAQLRLVATESPPQLFVLTRESEVIGFYHIAPARDDDLKDQRAGEITAIYLAPGELRQGYGRALCRHALQELTRRDLAPVILWVVKENLPACRFYEALGFSLDGKEKFVTRLKVAGVRYRWQDGGQV